MEREDMIKVIVAGVAVLAIAAPLLIGTMTALTRDGPTETYTVETEDYYDSETGELISTQPRRALDMVEYAKGKGADSWTFTVTYTTHDFTLYRNGRIIEQRTDESNWTSSYGSVLWYIHSAGYGFVYPYSAPIYLYNETTSMTPGMEHITFTYSKGDTLIEGYDYGNQKIYEQTVKMQRMWFIDIHGNYIVGPNSNVQYINNDDIYMFIRDPNALVHGDTVTMYKDGTRYTGTAEYTYTDSEDPVKVLTGADVSIRYYEPSLDEWIDGERHMEAPYYDIITPAELRYKEPYAGDTLSAVLAVIPVVVLLGIGLYLFRRLSQSE